MPEILTTIACEGEECGKCKYAARDVVCSYCLLTDNRLKPNRKRTDFCLSAESAARELREENERLWANLLNLTTGVLYLYNKSTGAYNPKRSTVDKEALRSLYELATKMHEESTNE